MRLICQQGMKEPVYRSWRKHNIFRISLHQQMGPLQSADAIDSGKLDKTREFRHQLKPQKMQNWANSCQKKGTSWGDWVSDLHVWSRWPHPYAPKGGRTQMRRPTLKAGAEMPSVRVTEPRTAHLRIPPSGVMNLLRIAVSPPSACTIWCGKSMAPKQMVLPTPVGRACTMPRGGQSEQLFAFNCVGGTADWDEEVPLNEKKVWSSLHRPMPDQVRLLISDSLSILEIAGAVSVSQFRLHVPVSSDDATFAQQAMHEGHSGEAFSQPSPFSNCEWESIQSALLYICI